MTMDKYWAERFERLKTLEMRKADDCSALLKDVYEQALRQCQKEVADWYARYASVNGISLADARKILDAKELKAFKMDLDEFKEMALRDDLDPETLKMLPSVKD